MKVVNTVYHGSESTSYSGPKYWIIISVKINEFISLYCFKKEIRNWLQQNRSCRFRKQYISDVGWSSCIFHIQSIRFVIFLLDFNDIYILVLIF